MSLPHRLVPQSARVESIGSWIGGSWIHHENRYDITDPATGAVLAQVSRAGTPDVDAAAAGAVQAFHRHRRVTVAQRADWCRSIASVLRGRAGSLAAELSQEHGKPVAEATGEVLATIQGFELAAAQARMSAGEIPHVQDPHKRVLVRHEPLGAWAVVTPWNFPMNIAAEYLGPAIATGNTVVWKPAPTTSRIAARLMQAILDSDVPDDVVQMVVTDHLQTARYLVAHPALVAVGFTGGTAAGQDIARSSWDKHLILELGGNGPIIVLDDAPLDRIAPAVAASAFWNAGQVCSAAGRILASARIAGDLADAITEHATNLVIGNPAEPGTTIGPLHLASGAERVHRHVVDAVSGGGSLLIGGEPPDGAATAHFYPPTVISNVPESAACFTQETFGPLAAITNFDDDDALLDAANRSGFGLVGALYTRSLDRAFRVSERIECGLVVVNDTSNYWEHNLPFGGAASKASGRGRLGGRYAMTGFTQPRAICLDVRG